MTALNLRVFKSFRLGERVNFRLDFLFDNVMNHPLFNFDVVNERDQGLNPASASFGRISRTATDMIGASTTATERNIRLHLKLEF